jgi:hypothetical protein
MGAKIGLASGSLAAQRLGTLLVQCRDFVLGGNICGLGRCLGEQRQSEAGEQVRDELHSTSSSTGAYTTQSMKDVKWQERASFRRFAPFCKEHNHVDADRGARQPYFAPIALLYPAGIRFRSTQPGPLLAGTHAASKLRLHHHKEVPTC